MTTNNFIRKSLLGVCACTLSLFASSHRVAAQLATFDRDNAQAMLRMVKDDLKANYYDPTFRGMNVEARFKEAEARIKTATSRDQLMVIVAQTLLDLDDSHTFVVPPSRSARVQYGWRMQLMGEDFYISAVKPKSDAEAKGLKPGDRVLLVDGIKPSRAIHWKMIYRYYALMPSRVVRLTVQSPAAAEPRELEVAAKVVEGAAVTNWGNLFIRYLSEEGDVYHDRFYEVGDELLIWNMPTFSVSKDHIDEIMNKARRFKTLVIDLRGNGGGYVETLTRLVSHFFDREIKIADLKSRKETKPELAKKRAGTPFGGRVVVLVDSNSGSASELFARVMQLEKRGTVLGDRSAGAVMTSRYFDHQTGVGRVLYFGTSVTIADVIMTDGKSLERAGVVPDELLVPTGADLAASRDRVLARAAELAGVDLSAEKAGTLFPIEWKRQ